MLDSQTAPTPKLSITDRWRRYRYRHYDAVLAWSILIPILIYYTVFAAIPVITNVVVSFARWNGMSDLVWVGFGNYVRYFSDPFYRQIFFNTALFTALSLLISVPLGLVVAVVLNQKVRAMGLYRSLWFVPTVTSAAIMSQFVA